MEVPTATIDLARVEGSVLFTGAEPIRGRHHRLLRNSAISAILNLMRRSADVVQLSPRGQITLPGPVRKALGLEPGDNLVVSVDGARVVIEPAVVVPIERYTEERTKEFEAAARMSPDEMRKARRKWRL
jgi:AbrB family looped-hinge helix DNA binding protein